VKSRPPSPDPKIIDLARARATGIYLLDLPSSKKYEDRCFVESPLGSQLDVELMVAFTGWNDAGDLPYLMHERDLITEEEMRKVHDEWQAGADLETLLLPLARRAYKTYAEGAISK
jgi:hypothetical protein